MMSRFESHFSVHPQTTAFAIVASDNLDLVTLGLRLMKRRRWVDQKLFRNRSRITQTKSIGDVDYLYVIKVSDKKAKKVHCFEPQYSIC